MHDRVVDGDRMRAYCLDKPGAWADQPWEGDHVAKVGPKIFAFLGMPRWASSAAPPARRPTSGSRATPSMRASCPTSGAVGWNVLRLDGAIPDEELLEAVDASYDMVVAKLPKKDRPVSSAPSRRRPPLHDRPGGRG